MPFPLVGDLTRARATSRRECGSNLGPATGQQLPRRRLQRHHPSPVPHPPSCHRPASCMCTTFRARGQSWCSWGWREAGEFGKWAVSCHCMFIFISKNLLAVVQRVTSVQQQIHHGWRAPWPPVAPQKSQKSTHFALHFEAQNERKSQDRLKRGRLPLFRGLSSQKFVYSCTSKALDGHVDHCASNELVDKFGTSPYAPHHLDSSRFWVSSVLPLYPFQLPAWLCEILCLGQPRHPTFSRVRAQEPPHDPAATRNSVEHTGKWPSAHE